MTERLRRLKIRSGGVAIVMLLTLVTVLAGMSAPTLASPFCGGQSHVSPPGGSLPAGATIAAFLEDRYVGGRLLGHATRATPMGDYEGTTPPIGTYWATLDGKRVKIATKDVVIADGIVRFITIKSRKLGKLQLWTKSPWDHSVEAVATYDVVAAKPADAELSPAAPPRLSVAAAQDLRISVYRFVGNMAELTLPDIAAVAVRLRWRNSTSGPWRELLLPVRNEQRDNHTQQVVWLGDLVCGMTRNLDAKTLQASIEADVRAQLVDGTIIKLTDDDSLKIQLAPPKAKQ